MMFLFVENTTTSTLNVLSDSKVWCSWMFGLGGNFVSNTKIQRYRLERSMQTKLLG